MSAYRLFNSPLSWFGAAILSSLLVTGCDNASGARECLGPRDCFVGESCIDNRCAAVIVGTEPDTSPSVEPDEDVLLAPDSTPADGGLNDTVSIPPSDADSEVESPDEPDAPPTDCGHCPLPEPGRLAICIEGRCEEVVGFDQISAGSEHVCGLQSTTGYVLCWGNEADDRVATISARVKKVAAGYRHSCALNMSGEVACWGSADFGITSPAQGVFADLALGGRNACGLTQDGSIQCWGSSSTGVINSRPNGAGHSQIVAGESHMCALRANDTVVCWGNNTNFQLETPSDSFRHIDAGFSHSCGVRHDGTIKCWGALRDPLVLTPPAGNDFVEVATGTAFSCARRSNGTVACWGDAESTDGQLEPPAFDDFTTLSLGARYGCGLRGPLLTCWGLAPGPLPQ
jgi:hypothetical protein